MAGAKKPPVDVSRIAEAQELGNRSEFDVLITEGVSFSYEFMHLVVQLLQGAIFVALIVLALVAGAREPGVGAAALGLGFSALIGCCLVWVIADRVQRTDRLVVGDHGIDHWRGGTKRASIGWATMAGARTVLPGLVLVKDRSGAHVWIRRGYPSFEFLLELARWVSQQQGDRSSLGNLVQSGLSGHGLIFRMHLADGLGMALAGIAFGGFGVYATRSVWLADDNLSGLDSVPIGIIAIACAALAAYLVTFLWRWRGAAIVISDRGVERRAASDSVFIPWAEMVDPEVLRWRAYGERFYARDRSGKRVIDDRGWLRYPRIARMVRQTLLSREMSKRGVWTELKALASLKL